MENTTQHTSTSGTKGSSRFVEIEGQFYFLIPVKKAVIPSHKTILKVLSSELYTTSKLKLSNSITTTGTGDIAADPDRSSQQQRHDHNNKLPFICLPVEIKRMIIGHLKPYGFSHLRWTCRRLYGDLDPLDIGIWTEILAQLGHDRSSMANEESFAGLHPSEKIKRLAECTKIQFCESCLSGRDFVKCFQWDSGKRALLCIDCFTRYNIDENRKDLLYPSMRDIPEDWDQITIDMSKEDGPNTARSELRAAIISKASMQCRAEKYYPCVSHEAIISPVFQLQSIFLEHLDVLGKLQSDVVSRLPLIQQVYSKYFSEFHFLKSPVDLIHDIVHEIRKLLAKAHIYFPEPCSKDIPVRRARPGLYRINEYVDPIRWNYSDNLFHSLIVDTWGPHGDEEETIFKALQLILVGWSNLEEKRTKPMFGTEYVYYREGFQKDDHATEVVRAWICDFLSPYMMTAIKKNVVLETKCLYCVRDEILHRPELADYTSDREIVATGKGRGEDSNSYYVLGQKTETKFGEYKGHAHRTATLFQRWYTPTELAYHLWKGHPGMLESSMRHKEVWPEWRLHVNGGFVTDLD